MSLRVAAYAVCVEGGRVLLARHVSAATGRSTWTLPGGGGVEHGEDPFDAVVREAAEEAGCDAVVERLLGVGSRVIPAAERTAPAGRATRTSASSTGSASPAARSARSRTAPSPSRTGPPSLMSPPRATPRWSTSASP
ncbi:hypothetical protein GCM10018785_37910 [Streptomyces longispororuber]|uniref:Nudix hydrolase domain-containing protein n=1 Tax=Streptomyces longispororuber TaxID=68230 RepID=A0A919DP77_9ACTN|nr:hypothetical protein GCM10018785_37910 [Streptomyces longispororuber]